MSLIFNFHETRTSHTAAPVYKSQLCTCLLDGCVTAMPSPVSTDSVTLPCLYLADITQLPGQDIKTSMTVTRVYTGLSGLCYSSFHKPCHSSDGKMKIELQLSDPQWTLWHYHNKLKIPNLVTYQWQAKRKLKRMKAHTIIQRTYNGSLYFLETRPVFWGGHLLCF